MTDELGRRTDVVTNAESQGSYYDIFLPLSMRVFRSLEDTFKSVGKRLLNQDMWAALGLTAVGLAHFLILDFGNQYGQDEWPHTDFVARGAVGYADGRPLTLLGLNVALRLLGFHQTSTYITYVALKICTAVLVYLLVRHFSPKSSSFPFACASLYLTYLVHDDFMIRSTYMMHHGTALLFTLLGLYFHFQHMSSPHAVRLSLSLVLATAAGGIYDGVFPVLVVLPLVVFAAKRDYSQPRVLELVTWEGVVFAGMLRLILPLLGLKPTTYASGLPLAIEPGTMLARSLHQFKNGLLEPLVLDRPRILAYSLPVAVTVTTVLIAVTIMRIKLQDQYQTGENSRSPVRSYLYWLLAGIGATWLGLLAILPTVFGQYIERVHTLAIVGEAVTLASVIWLISHLPKDARYRWLVRYVGVAVIVAYGTAQAGRLQTRVARLGGEWENQAYYLRSLAHFAPSVEEGTLFIYMHLSDSIESPFFQYFGFRYAMRYLYDDTVEGIWTKHNTVGASEWQADEEGIAWAPDFRYGWNEVIVVSRDEAGRAMVANELPPELYTEERAELYNPYSRIRHTFVSERVQELLPPVQAP